MAMMTWEDYESIMETLEILNDSELMENLSRSIKEIKEGKQIPWQEAKTQLGA